MMTDIAAPLSGRIPTTRKQDSADTDRSSAQNTEPVKNTDRQPMDPTERQSCQQADPESTPTEQSKTSTHHESFERTLQKHIEKKDTKPDETHAEGSDSTIDINQQAAIPAVIFQAQPTTPIMIKSVSGEQSPLHKQTYGTVLQKGAPSPSDSNPFMQPSINRPGNQKQGVNQAGSQSTAGAINTESINAAVQKSAEGYTASPQKATESATAKTAFAASESQNEMKYPLSTANKEIQSPVLDKPLQSHTSGEDSSTITATDAVLKKFSILPLKKGASETAKETAGEQASIPAKASVVLDSTESVQTSPEVQAKIMRSAAIASTPQATTVSSTAAPITTQVETVRGMSEIPTERPVDQIIQTLQLRTFGADSQVRMMLAPEELGAIRITFRQIEGEIVGMLEVQRSETRRELEHSVGQLAAAMESAGVQVRRIEVVPWSANNQSSRNDSSGQEFDAATHQEMHRYYGEGTSQNDTPAPFNEDSDIAGAVPGKNAYNNFNDTQRGLNFYI